MADVLQFWHADTDDKTADEQRRALADVGIAKKIGEYIERIYPGHWPRVEVDSGAKVGIIKLFHMLLPPKYAYVILLSEFNSDPGMKCIMRGWGEILERFNQPRGRISKEDFRQAKQDHWRLSRGIRQVEVNIKTGQLRTVLPAELTP